MTKTTTTKNEVKKTFAPNATIYDAAGNSKDIYVETDFGKLLCKLTAGQQKNVTRDDFADGKSGAEAWKAYKGLYAKVWEAVADRRALIDNGAKTDEVKEAEKAVYDELKKFYKLIGKIDGAKLHADAFTAEALNNRLPDGAYKVKTFTVEAAEALTALKRARRENAEAQKAWKKAAQEAQADKTEENLKKFDEAAENMKAAASLLNDAEEAWSDAQNKEGAVQYTKDAKTAETFRVNMEAYMIDMLRGRKRKTGKMIRLENDIEATKNKEVNTRIRAQKAAAEVDAISAKIEQMEAELAKLNEA